MSVPTLSTPSRPATAQTAGVVASRNPAGAKGRPPVSRAAPYLFLAPYFLTTALFFLLPLTYATVLAFYRTSGPRARAWVGMENFRFVLGDSDFHKALINTSVFCVASLAIQLPLSLGLAMLLNAGEGRTKAFFRLAIFSPNLVGQVFVGIMFSILFTPRYGMFNIGMQKVFGWGLEQRWLGDPSLIMPAIIIASLWMYVGFNMIYFLAALQNVDKNLVEAATIDGAGPLQIFRNVTLPAIMPVATFVIVTSTIGSFQLFELPYVLLGTGYPGPNSAGLTVVGYLYTYAFSNGDLGTGAATGWIITFIVFTLSLIQVRVFGKRGEA